MNLEIAHKLAESGHGTKMTLWDDFLEIAEAVVLALVAVTTAWCGYQAAKWDGQQAYFYGTSSTQRVDAALAATEGGQRRLLDVVTFNNWLNATEKNDEQLAAFYGRRFTPEYRVAFDAWLKTDPLKNPAAPAGPGVMPEYRNPLLIQSDQLNKESTAAFTEGTKAREVAEKYVRGTVLLATVLFLVALAQRFKLRSVRIGLLVLSTILMVIGLLNVATYPRL